MKTLFGRACVIAAGVAISFFLTNAATACVVIGATRLIYVQGESEVTVKISSNECDKPTLLQTWIDDGKASMAPADVAPPPFTVTPPFARLDPNKAQTLRILYTGDSLPGDKESVFWLNVVEVPPKPSGDEASINHLQLAFRTRIKLFYRPSGLVGNAADAPAKVQWRLMKEGNRYAVEAKNSTAFHVSISELGVTRNGKASHVADGGMIDPESTKIFPLVGEIPSGQPIRLHYRAINDFGGPTEGDVDVNESTSSTSK
ncbi:fimbria/pilus periplasmic chaperone [Burkholderia seminalis]|uniref:fimbria/pilus periplasmic chaperone n=1 Tax=Burkholderia seminalis TaxID=488731 RepID=UPI001453DE75|nr:fimbria/pilus periplasmic chaperone [Burkholderia seminalis]MCA8435269.1 fimbria/pilus periplasmic chaperone [Burkholderia seminalis]VWC11524.1 pilus assembly protein [Burkholderia seminalis]